ncbi:major facilitator superfamily domain-containing protein [Emericellopsis atlantica]|uniref:Major facilitator superfamily domain-containing protein n=1 Tax=Emericellopsis atlantica TaxID=2614577 RepID=A0A9P7ZHX2_9HYPO|nr:major facilitator superfamily domain-containing protein [Emericellopsis atlantica]KAG9252424.1 major facilitator superfamily domain-containing protein [Emericellopsis atlantica]
MTTYLKPDDVSKTPDNGTETIEEARAMQGNIEDDPEFSLKEQRAIIHRIDRRLVVMLGAIYCVSLIDRTNLSNAAIAGMRVDLELSIGFRYSITTLVFFITYSIFQPPATILTRKTGPKHFLSGLCFAWGVVMIGFGFINHWYSLVALRLVLGLFEAGFFPGCVYLISTWYSRYDTQKRYAVFYLMGTIASGLGGVLAYGLQQMEGLADIRGWRWIFIIEGIITCILGIAGWIFIVDFPDKALNKKHWRFLSRNEIAFILRRINTDRNDAAGEPWNLRAWASSGLDLKIWGFALCLFCCTTITSSLSFFLPIILRENMDMSVEKSQYLSTPPYFAAAAFMFAVAWVGEKYRIRGPLLFINSALGLVGLPLLGFAQNTGVCYFSTFLICISGPGGISTCMAYQANNIRGHWKRAFCSATLIGFGGIGGITRSLVFRRQDSPQYRPGVYACMSCSLLVILIVAINAVYFRRCNKKADKGEMVIEGDPNFRYTI